MYDMMAYNFKIQNLHLLNVQVSGYSLFPLPFMSNFRASLTTSSPMNKPHKPFSLISSSSSTAAAAIAPVSVASNSPNEHSFVVSYLINSCGLSPELALAKARNLKFNNPEKPDRVLAFFKKYGYTKSDVSNIVAKLPSLLTCNPENVLLRRFEFLRSLGLSNREITDVISTAPLILRRSMENVVLPCYNLLRCLLNSDDKAISVVKGSPQILTLDPEIDNVVILLEVGVPPKNIVASWKQWSRSWFSVPPVVDFREIVEDVKEMRFDPSHMNFLRAVRTMRSIRKSTWENRVQVLKKYGWSDHEVLVAFKKYPEFILTSTQTIDAILDFFVNQMGMEAASLANQPEIFTISLKKRIVPRCPIYQVLLEKGLFKKGRNGRKLSICSMLKYTEEEFLRKFLKPYEDEAPELLTLYQKKLDV